MKMKIKTLLVALVAIFVSATCSARDEYSRDVKVLPLAARTIISNHFSKLKLNHIKIDKNVLEGDDYDVIMSDGTEIEFDDKGTLKEVDCGRYGQVPDALVPQAIRDYVKRVYPKQKITKLDVKRKGYEVELQSDIDLVFDKQGNFLHVDD